MDLYPYFEWIENHGVGLAIRSSTYLFPVVESIHLLGLAVIGGAVLVVDLRLAGWLMPERPAAHIAAEAQPWLVGSLILMLVSGLLLFSSEAVRCYENGAFWAKMASLLLATTFTFSVRRKVAAAPDGAVGPGWSRLVAFLSVLLWSGVGVAGRGIAFY
jgi:hypothetical protein